ncbi:MAG TPA: hypothetical protein PL009_13165 [Flavipsychrobacter sp.]|nr:hypothetical protein [Flavipsychrobacter sp.]
MKKINMSLIITSVLVQSYITVSRAWAIGDKMYKNMKEIKAIKLPAATPAAPKTA